MLAILTALPRLFTGVGLPTHIKDELTLMHGGIRGARWEPPEKLHVTSEFIGEVDGGTAQRMQEALGKLRFEPFDCQLSGFGVFPPRGQPRILWIGVAEPEPLVALNRAVVAALAPLGHTPERRHHHPHVTVARLRRPTVAHVSRWVADHNLYRSAPFSVAALHLFSSVLSAGGSKYRVEAAFRFGTGLRPS